MRWVAGGLGFFVLAGGLTFGQNGEDNLSFEVASVKQSGPTTVRNFDGGPGTKDPGRYTATSATLRDFLFAAYRVPRDDYREQISGPGWIDTEKYDVVVKIPPGTTKEQFQRMFQNLLAERFKLVIHHETKVLPVYELVVAPNGPKLKASVETAGSEAPSPSRGPRPVDHDGFPIVPAGGADIAQRFGPGWVAHWTVRQQPLETFARALNQPMAAGRRVIDKTWSSLVSTILRFIMGSSRRLPTIGTDSRTGSSTATRAETGRGESPLRHCRGRSCGKSADRELRPKTNLGIAMYPAQVPTPVCHVPERGRFSRRMAR